MICRTISKVPEEFFSVSSTEPMNGREYANFKLHQAFHHYLKVVSTNIELAGSGKAARKKSILAYQMVQSSQIMQYTETEVPSALFTYDLSPLSVVITSKGKRWYEFLTSICAIMGGAFTVLGLFSGFLNIVFKSKKI